jgi:L-ascorbate metabolism protein UlaG (beta-lactamase superfamily)
MQIQRSPNYRRDQFVNQHSVNRPGGTVALSHGWDYFMRRSRRVPSEPLPVATPDLSEFESIDGLAAIWLGHATVLVRLDGVTLLIDPVFEKSIPMSMGIMSTNRFHRCPIALEGLPDIDAVIISHDHYDHLEMTAAQTLAKRGATFFVPLGVGAHLERWGVDDSLIYELDWYGQAMIDKVTLVCLPAQHSSGRTLRSINSTLWSSWAMGGMSQRVYYGGDTGYSDHFEHIGKQFGPFDLTVLPIGAYDDAWPDVHLTPEQAVTAHTDLQGRRLLPVHWGTFDLALHRWDEPLERLKAAVGERQVNAVFTEPGTLIAVD